MQSPTLMQSNTASQCFMRILVASSQKYLLIKFQNQWLIRLFVRMMQVSTSQLVISFCFVLITKGLSCLCGKYAVRRKTATGLTRRPKKPFKSWHNSIAGKGAGTECYPVNLGFPVCKMGDWCPAYRNVRTVLTPTTEQELALFGSTCLVECDCDLVQPHRCHCFC